MVHPRQADDLLFVMVDQPVRRLLILRFRAEVEERTFFVGDKE